MTVGSKLPEGLPSNVVAYDEHRRLVNAQFFTLGHGAQRSAAKELRLQPSRISDILIGRLIDTRILTRLDAWSTEQLLKRYVAR